MPRTKKPTPNEIENLANLIPLDLGLSDVIPIIPLSGRPIFPGIFTPLIINSEDDVQTIENACKKDSLIGVLLLKDDAQKPDSENFYGIGTVARIIKKINLPNNGVNIFISTIKRFRVKKIITPRSPLSVAVEYLDDDEKITSELKALTRTLMSEMREISENNPLFTDEMRINMVNIDNSPGKVADFIASILNIERDEQQRVLETLDVQKRIEQVLVYIKREQELLRIQKKIQNDLNDKVEKQQREYFLKEEMKSIKEELGIALDGKSSDVQKFEEAIKTFILNDEVRRAVESELEKFQLMENTSAEFTLTRNYLETICALPWQLKPEAKEAAIRNKKTSEPVYDIESAQKQLEKDHYGLEDVKKRVVEYLAVRKLKKDNKGSIILLVGPPGVGKTSIGRSIASAMNRPFFRFSVGGMRDEAEIKGHRRTYIGAMPGKIIQGLKITQSRAPVFLIDEIDKMGESYQGDPASALLEVLDPEQNVSFRDNYLDLPFDISEVLFVLTANSTDEIPAPLLDRAEIINLSGYIDQEKIEIAKKYLIPKSLKKHGLKRAQVKYEASSLLYIVHSYARESGVRNLEKSFDKIHRKLITEFFMKYPPKKTKTNQDAEYKIEKKFTLSKKDIEKYLGKPVFDESNTIKADKAGTSIGLAWTNMGGDTLLIEAASIPGKDGFTLTGQLGDVMKESANIAVSWAKKWTLEHGKLQTEWFDKNSIHMHIPEGATPKDGPSAGITMTTALLSLLTNKPIKAAWAMTGELSLTGKVLPIGGLREKTVAAKRHKIKHIIIPSGNRRDLEEIPEHVKKGITFHPVSGMDDVLQLIF